jgi:hypothetical protein
MPLTYTDHKCVLTRPNWAPVSFWLTKEAEAELRLAPWVGIQEGPRRKQIRVMQQAEVRVASENGRRRFTMRISPLGESQIVFYDADGSVYLHMPILFRDVEELVDKLK